MLVPTALDYNQLEKKGKRRRITYIKAREKTAMIKMRRRVRIFSFHKGRKGRIKI